LRGDGRLKNLFPWLGRRADIIGWVLIAWPILFLTYNEIYREGLSVLSWAEVIAYGVPVFALPLIGHLVKRLTLRQERLASTRRYLQNVIDNMGDLLVILDHEKRIVFGNPLLEEYFGSVIGRYCYEVFDGRDDVCPECIAESCLKEGKSIRVRRRQSIGYAKEKWFEVNISPFKDGQGRNIGFVEIWRDINSMVQMEEKLKEQALTGLRNSRAFFQAFPVEIKRARRQKHPLAVLMIDIDSFKKYNDHYGHPAGDKVLRSLGKVINSQIRHDVDSGYRYGGDEFAVILPYSDLKEAKGVAERIAGSFMDMGFPTVSLSVGILMTAEGYSMQQMVDMVDNAMYKAKSLGGNQVYVYGS
jgi:diguanylate cyclase (GGDEF)-like protein/PAS domain S-box-containing protein